jgi:hypothetical protein
MRFNTLLLLLALGFVSACASSKVDSDQKLRQQLQSDVRQIIEEELLPEIYTLLPHRREIQDAQDKAKKTAREKRILGRVEWVQIENPRVRMQGRVDTGAQTSSLHAENIEEKEIDGDMYVQFETIDQAGDRHVLLRKVVRRTNVRSSSGQAQRRYVIQDQIGLGDETYEIFITLNDRSDLQFNFLIGRNLLRGNYIVDVSQTRVLGRGE